MSSICPKCNYYSEKNETFCCKCGSKMISAPAQQRKTKWWEWILIIFFFIIILPGIIVKAYISITEAYEKNQKLKQPIKVNEETREAFRKMMNPEPLHFLKQHNDSQKR